MTMKPQTLTRREAITRTGAILGATAVAAPLLCGAAASDAPEPASKGSFVLCLNTATIRGQKLGLVKEIELAAKVGFQAIEPWVDTIDEYAKSRRLAQGDQAARERSGPDGGKRYQLPRVIVDDDARRAKGLERAKNEMDLVAQIGGKRIAAPPAGATNAPGLDLLKAAERYRALLEAGDQIGVTPQVELWGFSKNLHLLGEVAFVALESGHPKACVVADIFHIYKGGSDFRGLRLFSSSALQVFHMNDFPSDPPREKIDDSYRLFPGDGTGPITQALRDLRAGGGRTVLSLELFTRKYWEMDALEVATAGLAKMKAAVKLALGT